jgi:hypothetical protein
MRTITYAFYVGGPEDGVRVPVTRETGVVAVCLGHGDGVVRYELQMLAVSHDPRIMAWVAASDGRLAYWREEVWRRFCAWRTPEDWIGGYWDEDTYVGDDDHAPPDVDRGGRRR